jgi:hypothetical protein
VRLLIVAYKSVVFTTCGKMEISFVPDGTVV